MPRLPNFFIIGAPKAGTTSLYHYLDQHPQVYMSRIKEPHFFAEEIRDKNFDLDARKHRSGGIVTGWDDYCRLFANAGDESARGEASVCYLWSPTAPERIATRIPGAKILVMLRDPAERAFSQYLQGVGNGAIRWSFREHIQRNLRHRSEQFCVHYPFLEFGLYAGQLRRYLDRFGANVWVGFYEDFKDRPIELYQNICRFLGVNPEFSPNMDRRHLQSQVPRLSSAGWLKRSGLWRTAAQITPSVLRPLIRRSLMSKPTAMDPADRTYLIDFYREDIHKLASLLDRNLDRWLDRR